MNDIIPLRCPICSYETVNWVLREWKDQIKIKSWMSRDMFDHLKKTHDLNEDRSIRKIIDLIEERYSRDND